MEFGIFSTKLRASLGVVILLIVPSFSADTLNCMSVYKEGGAPAVFQSPKCPRWTLPADAPRDTSTSCQIAILQGRRRFLEDRAVCALDVRIPFLGRRGIKETVVGIVAVFDGHNGEEASDLASKLLLDYFLLHVNFLRDGIYSAAIKKSPEKLTYNEEQHALIEVTRFDNEESWQKLGDKRSEWISSTIFDESFHLEVLKESLLRTIHDIDVAFSKEALRFSYDAGSTATVSLIADGHILTANVGDSKSFLCSEKFEPLSENGIRSRLNRRRRHNGAVSKRFEMVNYGGLRYYAKELTKDHHPSREDERDRVEAAGGHIVEWAGVHRVNGQLALSRAIGDLPFKRYGVIPVPEVTDWQHVSKNDSFLIAASDGVFEKMTTQEVCEVLWNEKLGNGMMPSCMHSLSSSCADCIVNSAFERGSMDNLAAVVVPLGFAGVSDSLRQDQFDGADYSSFGLQSVIKQHARLQDTMNQQAGNLPCDSESTESPKAF